VIVALHHGPQFRLLPGVWCVRAYQSLPRAFRKNVKHVILLQPSMLVKTAVTLLYPFVSSKAHAKVKQVRTRCAVLSSTLSIELADVLSG
jgi:syndecan 1/collagen type V/XI/XXIV/XXVII alpha